MNLRIISIICILLLSLSLAGCGFTPIYAVGNKFRPHRVAELVEMRSTKNEVLNLFGEPLEKNSADLHTAQWWRYYYVYLGYRNIERAELEVTFSEDILNTFELTVKKEFY
jgi:outer membrane protein assembly factor BamE (lipoprotein component of BamABCDE complex)